MEMVNILKIFVRAERIGNWHLHLRSRREMILFLAASGYNAYTQSIYIYLSQMQGLQFKHLRIYEYFCNGDLMICQSDMYWAGLSPDLAIEQCLIKSI